MNTRIKDWKKFTFILIATALFVTGAVPVYIGLTKLPDDQDTTIQTVDNLTNVPEIKIVSGQSPTYNAKIGTESLNSGYIFTFKTKDVFAVDNQINYTVKLFATEPRLIKTVVAIFGEPNDDFSKINTNDADVFVKERSELVGDTVKLFPDPTTPNHFIREGNIKFSAERDLVLYFIIFTIDGNIGSLPTNKTILSVTSATAKLQADTNRAILDQIKETEKATVEQIETNRRVEGLTWITVGAIWLVIGADILIRIYLG